MSTVQGIITQVAQSLGVPVPLALAMAQQESGFIPNRVGDYGTSFGIYQLHQGGELGSLTPQQAFDPATNAQVSLGHLAAVLRANPGMNWGQAAAAAQRPYNPAAYAASVNSILAGYAANGLPSGTPSGYGFTLGQAQALASGGTVSGSATGTNSTGSGASSSSGSTSNPCQIHVPVVGCLWRASYSRALIGGALVASGALIMLGGIAFMAAYGLQSAPARQLLSTAGSLAPAGRSAPSQAGAPAAEPVAEVVGEAGMAA